MMEVVDKGPKSAKFYSENDQTGEMFVYYESKKGRYYVVRYRKDAAHLPEEWANQIDKLGASTNITAAIQQTGVIPKISIQII